MQIIETMRHRRYNGAGCSEAFKHVWDVGGDSQEARDAKAVFLELVPKGELGVRGVFVLWVNYLYRHLQQGHF